MTSASEWVRQIVEKSLEAPMGTEAVLKSLEKHIGVGEKAVKRVQEISDYIDRELAERRGGPVMSQLFVVVADYQEKVLESLAAA